MITDWETLADALRHEVQEYGELLNLFGQQQEAILGRDPDLVLAITELLERQTEVIDGCYREREEWVRKAAAECGHPADTPLRELLINYTEPVRLLLSALIDEINALVFRTKRRARQNQMLLSRSIDVSQQILQRLNPGSILQTYSTTGRANLAVTAPGGRPIANS
ncbi:MAG: flagellar protein FlgN [Chthoniobacteraceae bacterium]|nr:flagellar protein FlgN [Chthoniobacteraceae bacterium]